MARFYIKYIPPRRGLDMVEYLESYLESVYSNVKFEPAFYDNVGTFGTLTGEGDDLSVVLRLIESRFCAVRFTPEEFAGIGAHILRPYSGPEKWEANKSYALDSLVVPTTADTDPRVVTYKCSVAGISGQNEPSWPTTQNTLTDNTVTWIVSDHFERYFPVDRRPTWVGWMASMGVTVVEGQQLECAKAYKTALLKEISKKRFYDDNDSIADLSKSVMAITIYYPTMSQANKDLVDAQINIMKQIYTEEVAINGLTELTSHLSSILVAYYSAKIQVMNATTIEQVDAVIYE